jgi:carboxypeptidase Q
MRKAAVVVGAAALAVCLWAQENRERIDLAVAHRIRSEAFGRNSKVMDTAFYLSDVYGPRLTGSPGFQAAADWAAKKMSEWGLANIKREPWGPFGRGWSCTHFAAEMKEPEFMPLIGFAQPWSPGTNGSVSGAAVLAVINGTDDFSKLKGQLKGKVVLIAEPHPSELAVDPLSHRLSEAELKAAAEAPEPMFGNPSVLPLGFPQRTGGRSTRPGFRAELNRFLVKEGVLAVLSPGSGPDGGTVMGTAAGSPNPDEPLPPPSVIVTNEHYNRIARLIEHHVPVKLALDIQTHISESANTFNITAEIPGTDPQAGIVMLGGHLDSWTGGTGATDNAAGAAAAMEAMRILKALDLKMARTVRVALWSAEEQGMLGSHAYVREHFADASDMKTKPEYAKLSGYFNLDNGAGKIRGVYLQDNDMMRPILEAWLAPFRDLGATTLTIRATGSTDHVSFDAVGLPAFEFIQDPLEYGTRSHHSNMDLYDRLQADDLEQTSAVMAWVVYNAASRPEMLPRKPMPVPGAGRGEGY